MISKQIASKNFITMNNNYQQQYNPGYGYYAGASAPAAATTGANPAAAGTSTTAPSVASSTTASTSAGPPDYYANRSFPYQPAYMYNQNQQYYHPLNPPPPANANPAASTIQSSTSATGANNPPPSQPATSASLLAAASLPMQDTLNSSLNSSVGQLQPPGIRPRVTTTMWEDEKTLCYQVDANNVSVVRRADNNMINGTKLLNVAQMTRGRRDGILKSEKVRHVVKIGSMHLKGVWIPFERALNMAQRESIVDLLYPLFVRDIKRVIQTGVTPAAASATNNTTSSATPVTTSAPAPVSAASTYQPQQSQQQPQTSATSKTSPVYTQPDYSQYNQQINNHDQKQLYGYPNQIPNQVQPQTQPQQSQAQQSIPNQSGQVGVQTQPQYSQQQYPYYSYNQYSGQQMYQNYGGYQQVPPNLHQQPAPATHEEKKEEQS